MAPSYPFVNFLATSTYPEMSSWLMCEVSGFFPQDINLIWLRFQSKINTSYFATAQPTQEPGGNTFQTWSVLRIPVTLNSSLDTYTCVVEHVASQTKLNASKRLDISGKSQLGKNDKQVQHWVPVIKKYSCLGRKGLHCLQKRDRCLSVSIQKKELHNTSSSLQLLHSFCPFLHGVHWTLEKVMQVFTYFLGLLSTAAWPSMNLPSNHYCSLCSETSLHKWSW